MTYLLANSNTADRYTAGPCAKGEQGEKEQKQAESRDGSEFVGSSFKYLFLVLENKSAHKWQEQHSRDSWLSINVRKGQKNTFNLFFSSFAIV